MALKRLKWLKYLFVNRTEAETEQNYWNEKRKKHIANEHKEGVVVGLGVSEANPPSLSIVIQGGRAIDTNGNDPEVETAQEIDFSSLVPVSGTQTVYLKLTFNESEVEPYFVDEIGDYQNKYTQDSSVLEATTVVPLAPSLELARIVLAAGATEITDAVDPLNPVVNEIDLRYRKDSTVFVMSLQDLTDVNPDEADAFNNMNSPSAGNPIATMDDVAGGVSGIAAEVTAARGSQASLDARLDVSLNEDGSFKGIIDIQPAGPLTGGGSSGAIPIGIDLVTPTSDGAMSAADKSDLDANTAHSTGDGSDHSEVAANSSHRGTVTGNPHQISHDDLVGSLPSDAHHVRYTNAEARAAINDIFGADGKADKTIDMDSHILTGLPVPTANGDAASKQYVDGFTHARDHAIDSVSDHNAPAGFNATYHRNCKVILDGNGLPVQYSGTYHNNRERQFMMNMSRSIDADAAWHAFGTEGEEFRIRVDNNKDYMFHMRLHWYANPGSSARGFYIRFKFPNLDTYPRKFWAGGWQRQSIGISGYMNDHQYRFSVVNINGNDYYPPGSADEQYSPYATYGYMQRDNATTSTQEFFRWSGTYTGIDQGYLDILGMVCSNDEGWFYPEIKTYNYDYSFFIMQGSFLKLYAGALETISDWP